MGEHIPQRHALSFVRNLHAHNCRGMVISWACYGGHGHVNKLQNFAVIGTIEPLGYVLDGPLTARFRQWPDRQTSFRKKNASWSGRLLYDYFGHSLMVFRRVQPLTGYGCS